MARLELRRTQRWAMALPLASMLAIGLTGGAWAQAPAPVAPAAPAAAAEPSTNAMVNLIRLLVQQGTITQANGDALIAQASAEAAQARSNVEQAAANAGVPAPAAGTIRVPYVPETVRKQIAEQVRGEVMAQAKSEGWAAPDNAAPDWTRRITISGDIRVRSQSAFYSRQNSDQILNYAAINNTPGGFDFANDIGPNTPFLNTRQDRSDVRLRARLGVDATISEAVSAGIRIGTGDDASPISLNSKLGGGLGKKDVWLDRAFVRLSPTPWASLTAGRFANPFSSAPGKSTPRFPNAGLIYDDDLNFDGVAVRLAADSFLPEAVGLALTGGAFPLDFGSENFPDTQQGKRDYPDKWLFSGQLEASYSPVEDIEVTAAVGYHHFRNVQGRLSDPCTFSSLTVNLGANDPDQCSTDGTRAFFPRKGNSYFLIRQLVGPNGVAVNPVANDLVSPRNFLGLAQRFHILDVNASVSFPISGGIKGRVNGEYIKNLGFDTARTCRYGPLYPVITNVIAATDGNGNVINDNPCSAANPATVLDGDYGWTVGLHVGHPKLEKWGQWSFAASYRYLKTDATLDSLTDSDFHLGGTNTKGYTIEGSLAVADRTRISARWMSANEITGDPLAIDVLQIDLTTEF